VSTSLFGGTAPAVNEWLIGKTGDGLIPAYYMMAACVVGAIALITVPETTRCPINGRTVPGTRVPRRPWNTNSNPPAPDGTRRGVPSGGGHGVGPDASRLVDLVG